MKQLHQNIDRVAEYDSYQKILAQNTNTPDHILKNLAKHSDVEIRQLIAKNPSTLTILF